MQEQKEQKQPPNNDNAKNKDDNNNKAISFVDQVEIALKNARENSKILMVLCESEQITNNDVWNHKDIIENVQKHTVCLLIRNKTTAFTQFTALYPVINFPTVYCINPLNGSVLKCLYNNSKNNEQITVQSLIKAINVSIDLMGKQNNNNDNNNNNNNNNSVTSSAPTRKKAVLSKLEQIRAKAKAQKLKSKSSSTTSSASTPLKKEENNKNQSKSKSKKPKKTANYYNFDNDQLDVIESIAITRRNKLRKRKNVINKKYNINPSENKNQRIIKKTSKNNNDNIIKTPKSKKNENNNDNNNNIMKKSRIGFRINNEMYVEHYFSYNDKLIDVMNFIKKETSINDFVFISQYPSLNIDSIYLNKELYSQTYNNDNDQKTNEIMYNEMQKKLETTLIDLNLVPSCRVFIQPKFKGNIRKINNNNNKNQNIVMKIVNFVLDIIKVLFNYGYDGVVLILSLLWIVISIPLKYIGIVKNDNNNNIKRKTTNNNKKNNILPKRKSKLPVYKKDPRFAGRKSNMKRLNHVENQDDKNKYDNGNSTMFGGDSKK